MSERPPCSRRDFVRTSLAASSLFALPRFAIGRPGPPPGRRLNLAFIGAGGIAKADFSGCNGENYVALCDVDDTLHRFYRRSSGTILHVRSTDPFTWTGLGDEVFTERDARDVCLVSDGDRHLIYYCQSQDVNGVLRSCILVHASSDLETWNAATTVFADTERVAKYSLLESSFGIHRPEGWYLFISNRRMCPPGDDPRHPLPVTVTTVSFSKNPLYFGRGERPWFHEFQDVHAPEIVEADGRTWIVRVGRSGEIADGDMQGFLEIAPLHWEPATPDPL